MELVYLWVEDYKNIHQQGFNFSGRYRCDYDHEKNELTIDKNKDYIHIFPENISITAIVGENGSGKSSLFELILLHFTDLSRLNSKPQYCCIYHENDVLYIAKNIENLTSTYKLLEEKIPYYIHYDYSLTDNKDYYSRRTYPHNNIVVIPSYEQIFDKTIYDDELKNILSLMKENFYNSSKHPYFSPNQITINLTKGLSHISPENLNNNCEDLKFYIYEQYRLFEIRNHLDEKLKIPKLDNGRTNWDEIIANLVNNPTYKIFIDEILRFDKLLKNCNMLVKPNNRFKEIVIQKDRINKDTINLLAEFPKSIGFEIFDNTKGISYNHLSNGEKALLNIRLYLENVIIKKPDESYIILLDEAEKELHPQWQKQVVNYLIDSFENYKVHFILSSHSPFILSDIPKDNVIFLKDGKQFDVNMETFGANIHTLLSHGFFMKDGLMGEFAKEKINQIINYLNDKESEITDNKTAQKYINIIGEPILKRQLQKMLDSKRISRIDEIDELKKRIALLESKQ
ncbi:MAG: ATP-binding protein [Campylobacterales bacterium]|nr:ATP-binding protein [Campylobacterales bacterium]